MPEHNCFRNGCKNGKRPANSLRDSARYPLMWYQLPDLTGPVIVGVKVLQSHDLNTSAPFSLEIKKAKLPLPSPNAAVVGRYITSEKLTAGDYLLPSKNDRNQTIQTSELLTTVGFGKRMLVCQLEVSCLSASGYPSSPVSAS